MFFFEIIAFITALIGIGVLCYTLYCSYENGMKLYFIFATILPVLSIKGIRISFEICGFFIVLFATLLKYRFTFKFKNTREKSALIFLLCWFLCFTFSTVIFQCSNTQSPLEIVYYFGAVRYIILSMIMFYLMPIYNYSNFVHGIYKPILIVNLLAVLVQYLLSNSVIFFKAFYARNGEGTSSFLILLQQGYLCNAYGTTTSYTTLGIFASLFLCFYVNRIVYKEGHYNYIYLFISVFLGLSSGSKMFLFSLPIIVIVYLGCLSIFMDSKGLLRFFKLNLLLPFIVILGVLFLYLVGVHPRFIEYAQNPLKQLSARYGVEGSVSNLTQKRIILDHFLFGLGASRYADEMVGDSMYYTIMHDMGVLGTALYFLTLIKKFFYGLKMHNTLIICYVILIFALGVGDPLYKQFITILPFFYILFGGKNIEMEKYCKRIN